LKLMFTRHNVAVTMLAALMLSCQPGEHPADQLSVSDCAEKDARAIIQRYVDAWRGNQEMLLKDTVVLGFDIREYEGGAMQVVLPSDGPAELVDSVPYVNCDVVYTTDIEWLRKLDRGEVNALTAMGRARMSDTAPLDFWFPGEQESSAEVLSFLLPLTFHFWNRDQPEIIPFGEGLTRNVHGGNVTVFYYEQGVRTAWYQLESGMHINRVPHEQTNPFSSLFIMTRGNVQARLGETDMALKEGQAVLVPPGMAHEFWAEEGEYGELIVLMFGEGA
jgi:mannose-6-phosphate isomerase-like protein (cupin superfamily)